MSDINRTRIKNHIRLARNAGDCLGANHYYRLVILRYWPLRESVVLTDSDKADLNMIAKLCTGGGGVSVKSVKS